MKNAKHKTGIHLFKGYPLSVMDKLTGHWWWHIVASNGRIIARSSETYSRKGNAVKSIITAATIFEGGKRPWELIPYYDHSQPGAPVKYC